MNRLTQAFITATLTILVAACGADEPQGEVIRDAAMLHLWPITTTSDEARQDIADGVWDFGMGRADEAYERFSGAIEADPEMAIAHLYAAQTGPSLDVQRAHLARAVELAPQAGEVERLLIEAQRRGSEGDAEGALEVATELVELLPDNPRSWIELGIRRNALGDRQAAREAFLRAVQVAPDMVDPHLFLSWHLATFEPTDPAQAEQHARHAVELEPEESFPYDWLGDALRLQGRLEEAAAAYTTGAELDPMSGMLQQRAHVNSFLGNYAEARADYESAAAAATGNSRGTLLMYRAFVNLYEGDPQAAVDELEAQYQAVDGLGIPDPDGLRVALAQQQFAIGLHHRLVPVAERAGERLKQLSRTMADAVGTADLRRDADATAALVDGYLAAYTGDYERAEQQAQNYIRIRQPERSPTRNWPAHELMGTAALLQGEYEEALAHFDQSNPDSEYVTYQRALALEALGRADEARAAYQKVADYYFNSVQNALVRNEVLAKLE